MNERTWTRRLLAVAAYDEGQPVRIDYGQPGPFTESVEETVFAALRRVAGRVGVVATGPSAPGGHP